MQFFIISNFLTNSFNLFFGDYSLCQESFSWNYAWDIPLAMVLDIETHLMVRMALGNQYQTDSNVRLASGTECQSYHLLASGQYRVKSLSILAVLANFPNMIQRLITRYRTGLMVRLASGTRFQTDSMPRSKSGTDTSVLYWYRLISKKWIAECPRVSWNPQKLLFSNKLSFADLKRIFTNKMVSSICWCAMEGLLVLFTADLVMYFYHPFPQWICFLQIILRHTIVLRLMLLVDAMVLARYILIFWLKNPLKFQDDFWCHLVNTWVFLFRFSFNKFFSIFSVLQVSGSIFSGSV